MRAPSSLRRRLTATFTAVAGIVIALAAIALWILVERAVWSPLDGALLEEADAIAGLQANGRPDEVAALVRSIASESDLGPGKFARVIGADGRLLAHGGASEPAALTAPSPGAEHPVIATARAGERSVRFVRLAAPDGEVVEVGVAASRHQRTLTRIRAAILLGAALTIAVLAVLAWRITTRATVDLERLAREMETIEAGSLGRPLARRSTVEANRLVDVLNRLLARLDASMTHLRRFTADAAHELRTPIAALRAQLDATLAGKHSAGDLRDGLVDATEQADRLGRLAEDLLTLSAIESAASPPADASAVRLDVLARETFEFLQPIAQEQHRPLALRIPGPIVVAGSEPLLKRALLNLLENAFRHTRPRVAVEIALEVRGGAAVVSVRDQGDGIDPRDLPQVLEPFHRGRTQAAGSGLGLAIAREIFRRHRGDLVIESSPGRGTAAIGTLPLATAAL